MKIFIVISLLILFFSHKINSQNIKLINSGELIHQGIKLHDQGSYDEAIRFYNLVGRNDTNYVFALQEKALSYLKKKDYNKTIEIFNQIKDFSEEVDDHLYNTIATAYDESGQSEKSIELYKEALKIYPYSYLLHFNLGISQRKSNLTADAIKSFQKAIECNYFHSSSHYHLGKILYEQGRTIPAMLSLTMFILIEPNTQRSGEVLQMLESISDGTIANKEDIKKTDLPEDVIFKESEMIINSRIALDKRYKSKVKINDPLAKQLQVLSEKLQYDHKSDNFWMRRYVRFFINLYKDNQLKPCSYIIFSSTNNKDIVAWQKKNKSKVNKFIDWANNQISVLREPNKIEIDGKEISVSHWYDKNNLVQAIGSMKKVNEKESLKTGYWKFFYNSGNPESEGSYDDQGQKDGIWVWYYANGKIKENLTFKNGKADGNYTAYFENGILKGECRYINDLIQGEYKKYFATGQLESIEIIKDNLLENKALYYFKNGSVHFICYYKKGKLDSVTSEYYPNNNIKAIFPYKDGKQTGTIKTYFENGNLKSEGNLNNDLQVGAWKWFFSSGKLQSISEFDNQGQLHGISKSFYENDTLEMIGNYIHGKNEGISKSFDEDGKLYYEIEYQNNHLNKYKYFDKQGKIISQGEEKGGKLHFNETYPEGMQKMEGDYIGGKKEGNWKHYFRHGILSYEEEYTNDELNGKVVSYYKSGTKKFECTNKDGKADGYFKRYYRNGNLSAEGWFKNDLKEGDWISYHYNGKIEEENYYLKDKYSGFQVNHRIDGKKGSEFRIINEIPVLFNYFDSLENIINTQKINKDNCIVKSSYIDGSIAGMVNYKNGLIDGPYILYHPNGKISEEGVYFNDLKEGLVKTFDSDNRLSAEYNYKNGKFEGRCKWYNPNSSIKAEGNYKEGERIGEWRINYDDGKPERIENYTKEEELSGEQIIYGPTGELTVKVVYFKGLPVSYSYLDTKNNFKGEITFEKASGKINSFYANGNKSIEGEIKNGYYEGNLFKYYPNGKLFSECQYKVGEKEGLEKIYFFSGIIKSETNYYFGEKHGESKIYNDKGKLTRIEFYNLDEKHGDWKYYDDNEKLVKVEKYRYDEFYN